MTPAEEDGKQHADRKAHQFKNYGIDADPGEVLPRSTK
jgi:hypothetical protein